MEQPEKPLNGIFDPSEDDYYLVQSRLLVDHYLAERGITHEMLASLPTEEAAGILRHALEAAGVQLARMDAMIRLGNRDSDAKIEPQSRKHHTDRLAHHFVKSPK